MHGPLNVKFLKFTLTLSYLLTLCLPNCLFSSVFRTKTLDVPSALPHTQRATLLAHLILPYLIKPKTFSKNNVQFPHDAFSSSFLLSSPPEIQIVLEQRLLSAKDRVPHPYKATSNVKFRALQCVRLWRANMKAKDLSGFPLTPLDE
jgi:hypothetical protein